MTLSKGRIERANGTFQDRLVSELRLAGVTTIDEANKILQEFLPRFNERFGIPATQPEIAYRPVPPELDVDGVVCFKEVRKVAKDNTVQYHGQTLQIYPTTERTSYARAHVEVQERLDGQLVVCYRGKILSPGEAPPLASELRVQAEEFSQHGLPVTTPYQETEVPESTVYTEATRQGKIWYEDSEMRLVHRELVRVGMDRARQLGKRIGRPRVVERPQFTERFDAVMDRLALGTLSRRKAARELGIGYATLKRLLDSQVLSSQSIDESLLPISVPSDTSRNMYAEVLSYDIIAEQ